MVSVFNKHILFIIFLIVYISLIAYKLIVFPSPYYDWDESIYVQAGKEMLQQRNFLFPLWQGQNWFDKPPLIPLFYGLLDKVSFIPSEIITRLGTLIVSALNLSFLYLLYQKATKEKFLSTLAVIATAFTPLFLQRTQSGNGDVFVLLGWIGYLLFFKNFLLGLIFLMLAVLSKSLIGFYPIALLTMYYGYLYLSKKIQIKELKKNILKMFAQVSILSLWYIGMFASFGEKFFVQHVVESHFRRVSSSIEFHFGQKTFYIDIMKEQFGFLFFISIVGFLLFLYHSRKNRWEMDRVLYCLYLLPWFLFLNLTKTKIFWYMYPSLGQFAFLAMSPLLLIRKSRLLYISLGIVALIFIFYQSFIRQNFFKTSYSKIEPHHKLAFYAKNQCSSLDILINAEGRKSFDTLENMGLLITTTKWWGNHPSIIYYFGKKVTFLYDIEKMKNISLLLKNQCLVLETTDLNLTPQNYGFSLLKSFDYLHLFKKT